MTVRKRITALLLMLVCLAAVFPAAAEACSAAISISVFMNFAARTGTAAPRCLSDIIA